MKPEAQRIAISEACGWKILPRNPWWIAWLWGKYSTQSPDGRKLCGWLPSYLSDLNACHEMEKGLDSLDQIRYLAQLQTIAGDYYTYHASAAQRAEAFLRATGKWVSE